MSDSQVYGPGSHRLGCNCAACPRPLNIPKLYNQADLDAAVAAEREANLREIEALMCGTDCKSYDCLDCTALRKVCATIRYRARAKSGETGKPTTEAWDGRTVTHVHDFGPDHRCSGEFCSAMGDPTPPAPVAPTLPVEDEEDPVGVLAWHRGRAPVAHADSPTGRRIKNLKAEVERLAAELAALREHTSAKHLNNYVIQVDALTQQNQRLTRERDQFAAINLELNDGCVAVEKERDEARAEVERLHGLYTKAQSEVERLRTEVTMATASDERKELAVEVERLKVDIERYQQVAVAAWATCDAAQRQRDGLKVALEEIARRLPHWDDPSATASAVVTGDIAREALAKFGGEP